MSLVPGQVIHNRYKIITLLGQGGMGSVYEAMDLTLNVPCALKEMEPYPGTQGTALPQLREQFQQEARLLAELRHPNVPRVTDHFEDDGNAYLVMDFIHGKRLDEIVTQNGGATTSEVLGWARQLMEALAYCHEQGVIHRDVKPQNVIITSQGQAVLVDFGLAKMVDPDDPRTRTVMRGLGTPEYAPPEQYDKKKGRTDPRTDIYSLGATLYHALTGEPPPAVPERVLNPKSLVPVRRRREDVSRVTNQVLMKSMALRPPQRFQSIAEMHEALFGLPPAMVKTRGIVPSGADKALLAETAERTILLPWGGIARLRVDRRLRAALVIVGFVSLAILISWMTGRVSGGSIPTATVTPTTFITMTSTRAPTVTPSSTATPTATPTTSPTSRLPTRQILEMPDEFGLPHSLVSASPTPTATVTPTLRVVVSTLAPTPMPSTNTPAAPQPQPPPTEPPPLPSTQPPPTQPPPTQPPPTPRPPPTPPPTTPD